MNVIGWINKAVGRNTTPADLSSTQDIDERDLATQVEKGKIRSAPARSSEPDTENRLGSFMGNHTYIKPGFQFSVIEEIRCLALNNSSVSLALNNIINLANTGHRITFDASVKAEDAMKMRQHLEDHVKTWHYGIADANALASKFFMQAFISGAVCEEVVLDDDLKGVKRIVMPKPETIRFVYNKARTTYEAYQERKNFINYSNIQNGLIKLNEASFRYFTLNTDLEVPYGYPPYLPAIAHLKDQKLMLANINFIIQQMGIMGFLEMMVTKPELADGESEDQYSVRLSRYLEECKDNVKNSMAEGLVVGYLDDHEFEFHSPNKNASGVNELFNNNEILVSSGLKQDPMLAGKQKGAGEGYITVIFTKLISELKNAQSIVAEVFKHVYELELRLAGYRFKSINVEFKASTIQDDLKMSQALEIKIRNARQLYMDGVITLDEYAFRIGLEKADLKEPRYPMQPNKEGTGDSEADAEKKRAREKSKDASDRKVREKNKPGSQTKVN